MKTILVALILTMVSCQVGVEVDKKEIVGNDLSKAIFPIRVLSVFNNQREDVGFSGTKFTTQGGFSKIYYVDSKGNVFHIDEIGTPMVTAGQVIDLPKYQEPILEGRK